MKKVPQSVRKCQGACGKRITAEKPPMIIRSIGESWWTDKTTGKEMSRVGPMYVHFNQNALNSLVPPTENFYGSAKRFDFSRITINEENYKQLNKKRKERTKKLRYNIFVTNRTRHQQFNLTLFQQQGNIRLYALCLSSYV